MVEIPTKTNRFFKFFRETVRFAVLEFSIALIALLQKEFRNITGTMYIPAITIYITEKTLGEKGIFKGIISSGNIPSTKLIRIPARNKKNVTINPKMARNFPHLAVFKRNAADSGVSSGSSFWFSDGEMLLSVSIALIFL
jgi:hypothetical protein